MIGVPGRHYFLGLDLGLRRDPSAVVVLERVTRATGGFDRVRMEREMETVFLARRAVRFPLEMPYLEVPDEVARVLRGLEAGVPRTLTVDATGVGTPVVEMLKKARLGAQLRPVVITGGQSVGSLEYATTVPRRTLLEKLRMLVETRVVRFPRGMEGWEMVRRELLALGRAGTQERDDVAFALALAAWPVEEMGRFGFRPYPAM